MEILEILFLWLGTSVVSFSMEVVNQLHVFKDVADFGYKFTIDSHANLNTRKHRIPFVLFPPPLNVMVALQRQVQYNCAKQVQLVQLSMMDAIEEMSEIEKAEYLNNPTGLKALSMFLKSTLRLSRATILEINDSKGHSKIYYERKDKDIIIIKVSGPASRWTVEEQKKKVVDTWKSIIQTGIENYGDKESLLQTVKNHDNIELKENRNITISEQKQMLQDFKSELLEQENVHSTQMDKGQVFVKGRK